MIYLGRMRVMNKQIYIYIYMIYRGSLLDVYEFTNSRLGQSRSSRTLKLAAEEPNARGVEWVG